ncbi:MAG: hypothetical protein AVDCRST_MAG37-2099, partial [uncultured Rubrobacteraceae bacterium]
CCVSGPPVPWRFFPGESMSWRGEGAPMGSNSSCSFYAAGLSPPLRCQV